ncbi:MAG: hypothetical protein WBQ79_11435, partial [Acidobacteriaceae bacterium]
MRILIGEAAVNEDVGDKCGKPPRGGLQVSIATYETAAASLFEGDDLHWQDAPAGRGAALRCHEYSFERG